MESQEEEDLTRSVQGKEQGPKKQNTSCTKALEVFQVWISTHISTGTKVLNLVQAATSSQWREYRAWENLERLMTVEFWMSLKGLEGDFQEAS